jgi:hypothetical protein
MNQRPFRALISYYLISIFFLVLSPISAQNSVNTSGGIARGKGGTMSYSVGQVFYTSDFDNSFSISEGVQQSFDVILVGVNKNLLDIEIKIYPNPTIGNLILEITQYNNENLWFQIYDGLGKLLSTRQILNNQTHLDMSLFPSSNYIIKVLNIYNKLSQSYRIIKK